MLKVSGLVFYVCRLRIHAFSRRTVSNTLKQIVEWLQLDTDVANPNNKRQQAVKYPMTESALIDWFKGHQERVNLSGDLVCGAAENILNRLYPDHDVFKFSNGWLEAFKKWHGIRSYRRFGESGSVNMETIESNLSRLRETFDKFDSNGKTSTIWTKLSSSSKCTNYRWHKP